MVKITSFAAALALVSISTTISAQSANTWSDTRMRDARVQAGIVIPFGSAGSKAERAPRLEMWSDHGSARQGAELQLRGDFDAVAQRPLRIGLTFGDEPRLIRNGEEIPGQENRKGVSTLGWVGIGLGVALVIGGVLLAEAFKEMNN